MFETGISVECKVGKGTFMSEYYVKIECKGDVLWQGVVDKDMVFGFNGTPPADKFIDGRLYAYLISFDETEALIELPVGNSVAGRRITVPRQCVRRERIPA